MVRTKKASSLLFLLSICSPVLAHTNSVNIYEEGDYRIIESNGIPDHTPGQFPNAGNPNTISEQNNRFRVPLHPQLTGRAQSYGHNLFGVALNGVPFDPGTAEYWNDDRSSGWNYEAMSGKIDLGLDQSHAHVQPGGMYHYHGIPTSALRNGSLQLIGYAADGFPIYYDAKARSSYRIKQGVRLSGPGGYYDGTFVEDFEYSEGYGNLDECNWREDTDGYRYYLTDKFPFVPRCLKGEPDASFAKKGGQGQRPGHPPERQGGGESRPPSRGMPPQEAIDACQGSRRAQPCSFQAPHGIVSGSCEETQGLMACTPSGHRA